MIISFESCLFSYMSRESRNNNVNKPFPIGVLIFLRRFIIAYLYETFNKFLKSDSWEINAHSTEKR